MMNNKVTRIIANSVGLAAVAALGITVYQLGTSPVKEKTPEEKTENVGESTQDTEEQLSEDAGTNHVESENQWISDDGEDLDDMPEKCLVDTHILPDNHKIPDK